MAAQGRPVRKGRLRRTGRMRTPGIRKREITLKELVYLLKLLSIWLIRNFFFKAYCNLTTRKSDNEISLNTKSH